MDLAAPTLKLPVWRTITAAWATVPKNIGLWFHLYWPWMAIVTLTLVAWGLGVLANSGTATPSNVLVGGAGLVPLLVLAIAFLVGVPAIFVGWHRGIHRGERPAGPIQIDSTTGSYISYSLLIIVALAVSISVMLLVLASIAGITTGLGEGPMSLDRLAALRHFLPLAILPYYFLLSRFSLVLPAVAVGQKMTLGQSFNLTRGNTWRLTVGAGLVYFPVVVLSGLMEILMVAAPDSTALLAVGGLIVLISSAFCLHAALSFGTLALKQLAPQEVEATA
jgi:hypothetical protein